VKERGALNKKIKIVVKDQSGQEVIDQERTILTELVELDV